MVRGRIIPSICVLKNSCFTKSKLSKSFRKNFHNKNLTKIGVDKTSQTSKKGKIEEFMLPTNDYVFKRIFGHKGNESITIGVTIHSILNTYYLEL